MRQLRVFYSFAECKIYLLLVGETLRILLKLSKVHSLLNRQFLLDRYHQCISMYRLYNIIWLRWSSRWTKKVWVTYSIFHSKHISMTLCLWSFKHVKLWFLHLLLSTWIWCFILLNLLILRTLCLISFGRFVNYYLLIHWQYSILSWLQVLPLRIRGWQNFARRILTIFF